MRQPPLILGPVLRHVDTTTATIWVETSRAGEVRVRVAERDAAAATVSVAGHTYALVVVSGLAPGTEHPYTVDVDGERAWPLPDDDRPGPVVRTLPGNDEADHHLDLVFGSCRVDRPHREPYTLPVERHPQGVGVDALVALSRACRLQGRSLPDLLVLLGDQVYADEGLSPRVRERQVERRGDSEPRSEVADFEEYTWLYHDSWGEPDVRWLLATVPSTMIFDDHDVRDDWNTSQAWRDEMASVPWWHERIVGAYMSYWLYQHLGNLSPAVLAEDELWRRVRAADDAEAVLREFAGKADEEIDAQKASRWSYVRRLGRSSLVVVDTRSGRLLSGQRREMLSESEWRVIEDELHGEIDHLLVAASLPIVLERAIHDLEAWNEAVATNAAWGRRFATYGERIRQGLDLEHWAAFEDSFRRLINRLGEVAAGRHGPVPASVLMLSGDVHHAYVAPVRYPPDRGVRAPVVQLTSSPLRNAFPRSAQWMLRLAHSRLARLAGLALRRSARLRPLDVDWSVTHGPMYGNGFGVLQLRGRAATVRFEHATTGDDGETSLDVRLEQQLAPA